MHRCGRTARLGKRGQAVVFLQPSEDTYINFLEIRKVPVEELEKFPDATDYLPKVKAAATRDREIYEKGKLAFVTYVR